MGSTFGGTWEDPGGGFFEFAVKRALKQDQIVYMEGKLQVILYFSRECIPSVVKTFSSLLFLIKKALEMFLTQRITDFSEAFRITFEISTVFRPTGKAKVNSHHSSFSKKCKQTFQRCKQIADK